MIIYTILKTIRWYSDMSSEMNTVYFGCFEILIIRLTYLEKPVRIGSTNDLFSRGTLVPFYSIVIHTYHEAILHKVQSVLDSLSICAGVCVCVCVCVYFFGG